jgi:hypothetical protein
MSNMGRTLAALAAAIATIGSTEARAQATSQGFGLEVTAGAAIPTGDDFDALDPGLAFEAIGSVGWTSGWEFGIGAGFASLGGPGDENFDLVEVFGEGRYRFGVPAAVVRHAHPFLAGRIGYASLSNGDSNGGLLVGGGGGLEYWITDEVGLVGAGFYEFLSLDELNGGEIKLQAGVKVRF